MTEEIIASWDVLYDLVKGHHVRNAELDTNLFGKPVIKIGWADIYKHKSRITERNFRFVKVKWAAKPVDRLYSIKDLADMLPAEDFCEYLKDRKIDCDSLDRMEQKIAKSFENHFGK
jgi:hypothetical protein